MASEVIIVDSSVIRVRDLIKPYKITIVELQMGNFQAEEYFRIHNKCAPYINVRFDEKN